MLQGLETYENRAEVIHEVHSFPMQNIRFGRAGENLSSDVIQFSNTNGIFLENSLVYAPESNGQLKGSSKST